MLLVLSRAEIPRAFWVIQISLAYLLLPIQSQVLAPPYFNLAEGKNIRASSTCGADLAGAELYCQLVGANADTHHNINVIQGQVCDYCDPSRPDKNHSAHFAIDGSEKWYQSPPLSRGMKFNEVNVTIDLGQEFHVAYVFITMANSPRPGVWILERSTNNGLTYKPWQYFADSPGDCELFFGAQSLQPITKDDDVICNTQYSTVVPLEGGEIVVSLLNNRPSANDFFNSTVLQDWTTATNIRLRLLRTKTLLGHLMSVARQDTTVTRRYFYSIKDISIGGRCVCNGHADLCDLTYPDNPYRLLCRCYHHTCGPQCEECCPGYVQKAWRHRQIQDPFECEPCNCNGHSEECMYDPDVDANSQSMDIYENFEGGGVCQNCRHYTQGINCHKCLDGYYRPTGTFLNATDVCQSCDCITHATTGNCFDGEGQCECRPEFRPPHCDSCNEGYYGFPDCRPCDCNANGTTGGVCEVGGGSCPCKNNYSGKNCDHCASGFYGLPNCTSCDCNDVGSISAICDKENGQCGCRNNFGGQKCEKCDDGYYNYPACSYCNCDKQGTGEGVCNKTTGNCLCREGFGGVRCDQCQPGYYGYPKCRTCACSIDGSASTICDASGRCPCLTNFAGRACDQCSPGYYRYPECLSCTCDQDGSPGISCDTEGHCQCKHNFDGPRCNQCREGFYNFPICEECNCDPAGVVAEFQGCGSVPPGELCNCKQRVTGRICNECRPLYWNLQATNVDGCQDCDCSPAGVLGGLRECSGSNGQCHCKLRAGERRCDSCLDGYFDLTEGDVLGCQGCGCNSGGSVHGVCDKASGQCACRPRITGRTCTHPLALHYTPTLHHLQFEIEDGRTRADTPVRFGFNEREFGNFSWKGYAVFSQLQNEVLLDVYLEKPSVYRVIFHYRNPSGQTVIGTVTATPDSPTDATQTYQVRFDPSSTPSFVTVAGSHGAIPSPFVLNPGRWTLAIKGNKGIQLDFAILLPAAYYEASILQEKIENPCRVPDDGSATCLHLAYPNASSFDQVQGLGAFVADGNEREEPTQFLTDRKILGPLQRDRMVIMNDEQPELHLDLRVGRPGKYVLLLNYHTKPEEETDTNSKRSRNVLLETSSTKGRHKGKALIRDCDLLLLCREVFRTKDSEVAVFRFDTNFISLVLKGDGGSPIAVDSVVAIPVSDWSLNYIRPKPACVMQDSKCLTATFNTPPESTRVDFEQSSEDDFVPNYILNAAEGHVVKIHKTESVIDVAGKVPIPGPYYFILHYFQPDYPEFDVEVLVQNGQFYEGRLPVSHCPSTAGCRAAVRQVDGNRKFPVVEGFLLSLKAPGNRSVWVDYVLAVPEQQFREAALEELPLDKTRDFISQCGGHHFYLDPNQTGRFCLESAFALASDYNNGALSCGCDFHGSLSFQCAPFGGQCQCKLNVIGRRCQECGTGFFGFPDCRPCNCPATAVCDQVTGECVCPPRVTGDRCDECVPQTYGFDPIIGCEECNCSPLGVVDGNLQCGLDNGHCTCKSNVVSRTCDRCVAGYYAFPYCQLCQCDLRGTTENICDQRTSECFCKQQVGGEGCDTCLDGAFNIEESNPDGCTKCFCFGKATRCSSAFLYRDKISHMDGWEAVSAVVDLKSVSFHSHGLSLVLDSRDGVIRLGFNNHNGDYFNGLDFDTYPADESQVDSGSIYLAVPGEYLGNKLTSYGGYLNYTVIVLGTDEEIDTLNLPDIILSGGDLNLLHFAPAPDVSENQPKSISLLLKERSFLLPSGFPASRENLMVALADLKAIYVRVDYAKPTETRLEWAWMSTVNANRTGPLASSVEHCQCPVNYEGLSCEKCARGYFRAQTGPFGGFCVPCQCHGHAEECDQLTGKCLHCKHNTVGDHCEQCSSGYHGLSTTGSPYDCLICACPLPITSNNFAESCEVNEEGTHIRCNCKEGYYGPRCEACAAGYFGLPEIAGEYCSPCDCSGNIDSADPSSCDSLTGDCLRCLNNTSGSACNLCAPGYYGDAIALKDCRTCSCDRCGTAQCDSYSGHCSCQPNVANQQCDSCIANHWGFQSCQGCTPCDCDIASDSKQCDEDTGQCECRPGVTGRKCDRCAQGYWNYTPSGCQECSCNVAYAVGFGCNEKTGQCECLPGVIGEQCDTCPHRWVLVPSTGCIECLTCVHSLLDDEVNALFRLNEIADNFQSAASTYFTSRRLAYINQTAGNLDSEVSLLSPDTANIQPLQESVTAIEEEARNIKRATQVTGENSEEIPAEAAKLLEDSHEVERMVEKADNLILAIVQEVSKLATGLENAPGPQVLPLLTEAEKKKQDLEQTTFFLELDAVQIEHDNSKQFLSRLQLLSVPGSKLQVEVAEIRRQISETITRVDDLRNQSQAALEVGRRAADTNARNKASRAAETIQTLEQTQTYAEKALSESRENLKKAKELLRKAENVADDLAADLHRLQLTRDRFNETISDDSAQLPNVRPSIREALDHATRLQERASQLDGMLTDTREASQSAILAATSYSSIVAAIKDAETAAREANITANNATNISTGLGDRTSLHHNRSTALLSQSHGSDNAVTDDLRPQLDEAKENMDRIDAANKKAQVAIDNINRLLERVPEMPLEKAHQLIADSEQADFRATSTLKQTEELTQRLPEDVNAARQIPRDADGIYRATDLADNHVKRAVAILPDLQTSSDNLSKLGPELKKMSDDTSSKLEELRKKVLHARDIVSQIRVGVTFHRNTSVQVRNPPGLAGQAAASTVSLYFKTREENGFLLFLGNEQGTSKRLPRTATDDYLALEVENGHLGLIIDLGSGHQKIVVADKIVSDGMFYQAIVERSGKRVKLSVREENADGTEVVHTVDAVLPGTTSLLNLDQEESVMYVGGFPLSTVIPQSVRYGAFEGEIEELKIGDTVVGLWNFVDADNMQGAYERDKLVNLQPVTGFRFDGLGHVALSSQGFRFRVRTDVSLRFNTKKSDALLFLALNTSLSQPQHLAIYLKGGRVHYQVDLGDGPVILRAGPHSNDGEWHKVEADRERQQAVLKVDGTLEGQGRTHGYLQELWVDDRLFVGGYPGRHPIPGVPQTHLDGCVDEVQIDSKPVDLSQNIEAVGVTPGCPPKIATLVSFAPGHPGVVTLSADAKLEEVTERIDELELSLRFRTTQSDGLLFYAQSRDTTQGLWVLLRDGSLEVVSRPGGSVSTQSPSHYHDDQWHVITVTRRPTGVRLDIDDFDVHILNSTVPLQPVSPPYYIGSVPSSFVAEAVAPSFTGCVGDVVINGEFINFANTTTQLTNAALDRCPAPLDMEITEDHGKETSSTHEITDGEDDGDDETEGDISTKAPSPIATQSPPSPPPTPEGPCLIAIDPIMSANPHRQNGRRFGAFRWSRLEYASLPMKQKNRSEFSLKFRTTASDGLIFYVADLRQIDFISLYIKDGKVHFSFNCGSGLALLISDSNYDDGEWHSVTFRRLHKLGRLLIDDGTEEISGESQGNTKSINVIAPYFVGGLREDMEDRAKNNLKGITQPFSGCIRDATMSNKDLGEPTIQEGVFGCSNDLEDGMFFWSGGGYVKAFEQFNVGHSMDMMMEIRPRSASGLLLTVQGRKDYLVLQLIDGKLHFEIDNGKGAISSVFVPPLPYYFCDGNWHQIRAVKAKNVVTLAVDNVYGEAGIGVAGVSSTDTNQPFYVGGHPDISSVLGIKTNRSFQGCIRKLVVSKNAVKFTHSQIHGNVTLDFCPAN